MCRIRQRKGKEMTKRKRIKNNTYLVLYYNMGMKYGNPMTGKNIQTSMLTGNIGYLNEFHIKFGVNNDPLNMVLVQ